MIPLVGPMDISISFKHVFVENINNELIQFVKHNELEDGKILKYTGLSKNGTIYTKSTDLSQHKFITRSVPIDENHKEKYMKILKDLKNQGIDFIEKRKKQINNEIERVSNIKKYFLDTQIQNNFNYTKNKHIKETFSGEFSNITRKDLYGMFCTRLIGYKNIIKHYDELNCYNIGREIIDDNLHESTKNKIIKETLYKYVLLLVLKTITEYISFLEQCIININTDPYYSCDSKFGMNNVTPNKIVEINENNRHLIELDDYYDKIFIIKDYHTPGVTRTRDKFNIANSIVLCKSKPDRGNKWNIFPASYKNIGNIQKIMLDDILDFEEICNCLNK